MKFGVKMLTAAVLSLLMGIAFASPLFISDLKVVPFYTIPQGPKAEFSADIVYANFSVQQSIVETEGGVNCTLVRYFVVLNITNLSDSPAKVGLLDFGAAKAMKVEMEALGGRYISSSKTGTESGATGTTVEGVWLDDQWINVTWVPGEYPNGIAIIPQCPWGGVTQTTIPNLPDNTFQSGYLIEGVPIYERHVLNAASNTMKTYDYIYVNGSWVDVTGRISVNYPQPTIMATNTLVYETLHVVSDCYFNALSPTNTTDSLQVPGMSVVWSGEGGFDKNWKSNQSRLIMMRGTKEVHNQESIDSLETGRIMLYGAVCDYLKDKQEMNGTLINTYSTATNLKEVQLQKTADGYIYNAIMSENQRFQPDQWGIEVFIKPRS
jgi:hypothetical protein